MRLLLTCAIVVLHARDATLILPPERRVSALVRDGLLGERSTVSLDERRESGRLLSRPDSAHAHAGQLARTWYALVTQEFAHPRQARHVATLAASHATRE